MGLVMWIGATALFAAGAGGLAITGWFVLKDSKDDDYLWVVGAALSCCLLALSGILWAVTRLAYAGRAPEATTGLRSHRRLMARVLRILAVVQIAVGLIAFTA